MQISRQMLGGSQHATGPSVTSCSNSIMSKTTPGSLSEKNQKTERHLTSCFYYFFGYISNVLGFFFFSSKNAEHSTNMSNTWFVLFKVIV